MKLKTLIPVSYANGINTLTEGIIEGKLIGNTQGFRFGYSSSFGYEYNSLDGYIIKSASVQYTSEEINSLYELVKTEIPLNLPYTEITEYLYYLGMRVKMSETFGITINDIELVIE